MRAVIQRVLRAHVEVEGEVHGTIGQGLLVLLGIGKEDSHDDLEWLVHKVAGLRVFKDDQQKMNLSIQDVDGQVLVVSQFTLYASTQKGFRPSFMTAALPEQAIPLYESFIKELSQMIGRDVENGVFGADMNVSLVNQGPVTICIDTKNRE